MKRSVRRILNRRKYRDRYGPLQLERLLQLETITPDRPAAAKTNPWSLAIDGSVALMFGPTIVGLTFAEGLLGAGRRH